jgi:hypothetical protein
VAQRVGQADVEIGARAGAGLALLAQGRNEDARVAHADAAERMRARTDWFQGRELAEALAVRVIAAAGAADDAKRRHEEARQLAEPSDFYGAATLVAECGDTLLGLDGGFARRVLLDYAPRVRSSGFGALERRYEQLLTRA